MENYERTSTIVKILQNNDNYLYLLVNKEKMNIFYKVIFCDYIKVS